MGKDNLPLVSVIIPMYNAERFIVATLSSVFAQTYKNMEVIVVNDNSTDKSANFVRTFFGDKKNLVFIQNEENKKVAETRNIGVKNANGKYIAFLDADDKWEEDKIEKQVEEMENNNSSFCYTSIQNIDDAGNELNKKVLCPQTITYKDLLQRDCLTMSSIMVTKELCEKYPFENEELREDFIFFLSILKNENSNPIGLSEYLTINRFANDSRSSKKSKYLKIAYKTYRKIGLGIVKSCHYVNKRIVKNIRNSFAKRSKK